MINLERNILSGANMNLQVKKIRIVLLTACVASLLFFSDCNVQKRRYRPGYHTSQPAKPSTVSVNTSQSLNNDSTKYYSSPFLSNEPEGDYASLPCDTIYFNDGRKITAVFIEKTYDEVKYFECNTNGPSYGVYKTGISKIVLANGKAVELEEKKPAGPSDSLGCDKIYYKNGNEIMVHVVETTNDEIKYKECGDKDGIAYSIYKKEVVMIKRANGAYDAINTSLSENAEKPKQPTGPVRNKGSAFILCLLLGAYGAHRFYLGYPVMGVLYLLTCGFLGIGIIIDLIRIATGDLKPKGGRYSKGGGIPL